MHAHRMRHFKNCHLARMSDGHFCIIRDLGPVKGGKGLKHHEVIVDFTWQALAGFVLPRRRREPLQTLQTAHNGPKTETKARGGVRTRSDGDPRQIRNSH
jgi:hypothetical protein